MADIAEVAKSAEIAGADAVSLVNTFLGMAIDTAAMKPRLGNVYGGYSGRAIKPMSLYRTWRVSKKVGIPVIAGGGVCGFSDVLEFIMAGAAAVSLGTVNLVHPGASSRIFEELKSYVRLKKIKNIHEIKGVI